MTILPQTAKRVFSPEEHPIQEGIRQRVSRHSFREIGVRMRRELAEIGAHSLFYLAVRRHISPIPQKVLIVGVYRHKNAPIVAAITHEAKKYQWKVCLWALDRIHPSLESCSLGSGSGLKFPLLNELIRHEKLSEFDWVVVTDDDFLFEYGSLATFLALAGKAGMALVQPSHSSASFSTYPFSLCNASAIARLTTFVEIGPVFAVGRAWYDKVFPFPEEKAMGWGLDVEWSDLRNHGARLGIIDWVAVRHLHPVAANYNTVQETVQLRESLRVRGLLLDEDVVGARQSLAGMQRTVATWHLWHACPPWLGPSSE